MTKNRLVLIVCVAVSVITGDALAQGALDRIKAAKAINVAYSRDSLPFSFSGPGSEPAGYTIDLCKRVIAQISRATGVPDLKITWVAGTTPERLQMIASGRADLDCANTTQTLGRLANVDFSSLIFLDAGGFLVRSDSTINRASELAGKKIVVLQGTTTETRLRDVLRERLINATIVPINDAKVGVAMLEAGSADAYAGDKIKLVGLAVDAKNPEKLALLTEELSFEPYAIALPRNDSALRLEVNRALSRVYLSGEIETIFNQWLGKLGRPTGLLAGMYLLYSIPE